MRRDENNVDQASGQFLQHGDSDVNSQISGSNAAMHRETGAPVRSRANSGEWQRQLGERRQDARRRC